MAGPTPRAAQSTPILPLPHRVEGAGDLVLRGEGEVSIAFDGTGQAVVLRHGVAAMTFEGQAVRRFPSAEETVFACATGTLSVRGTGFEVRVHRARVSAWLVGRFEVETDGRGEVRPARGAPRPWAPRGHVVVLDRATAHEKGGEAA